MSIWSWSFRRRASSSCGVPLRYPGKSPNRSRKGARRSLNPLRRYAERLRKVPPHARWNLLRGYTPLVEPLEDRQLLTTMGVLNFNTVGDGTPDSVKLLLTGTGGDTLEVSINGSVVGDYSNASVNSINVTGSSDDDTLTVDESGGVIAVPISFDGGGGANNQLIVTGYSGDAVAAAYTGPHSGTVQVGAGGLISYQNLTPLTLGGTASDLVVTLPAGTVGASLEDDGTPSNGTSELASTNATFETTTFSDPTNSLTVNAGGGTDAITTAAGFSGDFTAGLTINGTAATDTVTLNALNLTTGAGTLSVTAKTINLNDNVTTSNDQDYQGVVTLSNDVTLTGTTAVTFESTVDSDALATPRSLTVDSPATAFEGEVGAAFPLDTLTVDGTATGTGTTDINTDIVSGATLDFKNAVSLTSDTTLTGTTAVTFESTVDSDALATPRSLTVDSPATAFEGEVGTTFLLDALTVDGTATGTGTTDINTDIVSGATLDFKNAVSLTSDSTLTGTAGNITFEKTVDGAFNLTTSATTAGKATTFEGAVGNTTALASLTVTGAADLNIVTAPGVVKTTGDQDFKGAVTLTDDAMLTSSAGNMTFEKTVDGAFNLATSAATAGKVTTFEGAVGNTTALASLTLTGAGDLNIVTAPGVVKTTGDQDYKGAVTLTDDATLTSTVGNITFEKTVDGAFNLTIDTTGGQAAGIFGTVAFDGNLGGGTPLGSLTVAAGGPLAIEHDISTQSISPAIDGNILLTVADGAVNAAGDDLTIGDLSPATILSHGGTIEFRAGDNILIAAGATISTTNAANTLPAESVTIRGDYDNNDTTTAGTTINLDGVINSPTITVFGGDANDTINLQQTQAATSTTINPGLGANKINISSTAPAADAVGLTGRLSSIQGAVTVNGGVADTLNLGDAGEPGQVMGTLTATQINGLGMGPGITYSGLNTINLTLGQAAGEGFNVQGTPAATTVNVFAGQAGDTISVGRDGATTDEVRGPVNVHGGAGPDQISVGGTDESLDNVPGLVTIDGAGGKDTLTIDDRLAADGHHYDFTNQSLVRDPPTPNVHINFTNVELITTYAATTTHNEGNTVTFFAPAPLPGEQFQFDGGNGPLMRLFRTVGTDAAGATLQENTFLVGDFGSNLPIQIRNFDCLDLFGATSHPNDLENHSQIDAVIVGQGLGRTGPSGGPADTLVGSNELDTAGNPVVNVIFGGAGGVKNGTSQPYSTATQIIAGGKSDYIFADQVPVFNSDGTLNQNLADPKVTVPFGGERSIIANGATVIAYDDDQVIDAGVVVLVNGTKVQLDTLSFLKARILSQGDLSGTISQALALHCMANLMAPPNISSSIVPPPPPPNGNLGTYVTDVYIDLLGRAPDSGALAAWTSALANGLARTSFTDGLTHSAEYYGNIIVTPAYFRFLGRAPEAAGLSFWVDQFEHDGLTDERLEADFVGSPEFYQRAGGTDKLWVDAMYVDLLDRPADPQGETYWIGQLAQGVARTDVAYGFADSLERERQRVTDDYMRFLGRLPDQAGIDAWVNQFAHGLSNEDLQADFTASDEYFAKHS